MIFEVIKVNQNLHVNMEGFGRDSHIILLLLHVQSVYIVGKNLGNLAVMQTICSMDLALLLFVSSSPGFSVIRYNSCGCSKFCCVNLKGLWAVIKPYTILCYMK